MGHCCLSVDTQTTKEVTIKVSLNKNMIQNTTGMTGNTFHNILSPLDEVSQNEKKEEEREI